MAKRSSVSTGKLRALTALTHPAYDTWSSSRGLSANWPTKPDLGAGFTLRCLQRLSVPAIAIQPYR